MQPQRQRGTSGADEVSGGTVGTVGRGSSRETSLYRERFVLQSKDVRSAEIMRSLLTSCSQRDMPCTCMLISVPWPQLLVINV